MTKGPVINYGEDGKGVGLQNSKIAGLKLVVPPSPRNRVKLSVPPYKGMETF